MNIPNDLKYTSDHEWVKVIDGDIALVGITDFAQSELGDLVYVEIGTVGETLAHGDVFGTVEAVKTTSDLYLPVSGEVLEFNAALDADNGGDAAIINTDPYEEGWIIKVRMSDPGELASLLDATAYAAIIH
jgi:glycine cleavage system H protein